MIPEALKDLLTRHNGNVSAAARAAGMTRLAFYRLMQRTGVAKWNTETRGIAHRHSPSPQEDALARVRVHVDGLRAALTVLRGTPREAEAVAMVSDLLARL